MVTIGNTFNSLALAQREKIQIIFKIIKTEKVLAILSRFRIEHLAIAMSRYNSIFDLANYILHVKTFDNFNLVIKKALANSHFTARTRNLLQSYLAYC